MTAKELAERILLLPEEEQLYTVVVDGCCKVEYLYPESEDKTIDLIYSSPEP